MKSLSTSLTKSLFDQSFKEDNPLLYWLFWMENTSLSCAILDSSTTTFIGLQELNWDKASNQLRENKTTLEDAISNLAHSPLTDQKVIFGLHSELYTLIPKSLFNEKSLEDYMNLNFDGQRLIHHEFHFQLIEAVDAYLIYALPKETVSFLSKKFKSIRFTHPVASLIELNLLRHPNETMLSLHLYQESFEIYCQIEGQFNYINSFKYTASEDVVYYLLYVMEQLNIDRENCPTYVYGELEPQSELYTMLFTYIRNVHFGERNQHIHYSSVLQEVKAHHHYSLFSQYLCV